MYDKAFQKRYQEFIGQQLKQAHRTMQLLRTKGRAKAYIPPEKYVYIQRKDNEG